MVAGAPVQTGRRVCTPWDRILRMVGVGRACAPVAQPAPLRRVLVLGAVGLGALVVGTFLAGDDDDSDDGED